MKRSVVLLAASLSVVGFVVPVQSQDVTSIDQVTSVSQLTDVKPTDWAFQALQSLVERYGCIAGYPDKTYRGNRAITRYEFAAGLNACMDRVNDLIAASTVDSVKKEDLATLRKLQEQFAAELGNLRDRTNALEGKVATLEKQQFSTTTKLSGEVIFALSQEFNRSGNQAAFQDRVRLVLKTSFTGRDVLETRLSAGNARPFDSAGLNASGDGDGLQTFNLGAGAGYNNSVGIDLLAYHSQLGDKFKVYVGAVNGTHKDYAPTINPALDAKDGGTTTLSVFGQRNPIYNIGGGSGLGLSYDIGGGLQVSGGYFSGSSLTTGANSSTAGNGLFNGGNSFLAQVSYVPGKSPLKFALTYVNAYQKSGAIFDQNGGILTAVGTTIANNALGVGNGTAKVNAYGMSAAYQVSPQLVLNAFGTYATADFGIPGSEVATIFTYGLGVALPDFGKKGNLLGFVVGGQPYASNANLSFGGGINSVPVHVEGFYRYQVNDRLSVTPGLIWLTNPGQIDGNKSAVIGTLRTTFSF
jgi:Carbohydrate-selective porin, OprB family/S-layer homology domain